MANPALNDFLKWSVLNTDVSQPKEPTAVKPKPISQADREAFDQMLRDMQGGSDVDRMRQCIMQVNKDEVDAEAKYVAFKNLEMLIQNGDNADNLENIKIEKTDTVNLWDHLIKHLDSEDPKLRSWTAWCCSTAVQNRIKVQKKLVDIGAMPTLVRMATTDPDLIARKKAINALSSTVRNFQPGLDTVISHMPAEYKPQENIDAGDMDSVDVFINKLRESL